MGRIERIDITTKDNYKEEADDAQFQIKRARKQIDKLEGKQSHTNDKANNSKKYQEQFTAIL
jgi:hypothetical protein